MLSVMHSAFVLGEAQRLRMNSAFASAHPDLSPSPNPTLNPTLNHRTYGYCRLLGRCRRAQWNSRNPSCSNWIWAVTDSPLERVSTAERVNSAFASCPVLNPTPNHQTGAQRNSRNSQRTRLPPSLPCRARRPPAPRPEVSTSRETTGHPALNLNPTPNRQK